MDEKRKRIWEMDFFRGIALIAMVVFHVVFDLKDIYNYPVYYDRGFFYYVGKFSAILFMLVGGISCHFSRSNVKRGARIFGIAMVITLVTHLYDPVLGIKFGILHFFGISMMLYPVFKSLKAYALTILGTIVIVVGNILSGITVSYDYLFPIGIISRNFNSSDYYPLFPWFGVFLYGMALGKILYREKKSIFNFTLRNNPLMFMGRHTMVVYIIHQPIILLVLNLIMK